MTEQDWDTLIEQIDAGECTPFLGAGASMPFVEVGADIARRWASESNFPLDDSSNLGRVAQYMGLNFGGDLTDPGKPKRKMVSYLATRGQPQYGSPNDLFTTLAELKLPVYITTNYDSFLTTALQHAQLTPQREFCRWNKRLEKRFPLNGAGRPTPSAPLVYHLHGHDGIADSLVISEDDYIDFIVNVSQRGELIPAVIQDALTDNTLLFLGYSLADWNLRVLFSTLRQFLENSTRTGHIAVQLPPTSATDPDRAARYLEHYFRTSQGVTVFWGTWQEFNKKLREKRGLTPPDDNAA